METVTINSKIREIATKAIEIAIEYEKVFVGKRKLGITGEIGEFLAADLFNLSLILDTTNKGYDAIDCEYKTVQIKCCRSETLEISPNHARVGKFSIHNFDYALLVLLGRKYEVKEIWRAEYHDLLPVIENVPRRNPNIGNFKNVAKKVI